MEQADATRCGHCRAEKEVVSMSASARRGLWLLPLAGVLTGVPWFEFIHVRPGQPHVARDEALRALSLGDQVATYAYGAGFLCLLFGLLALHASVMSRRPGLVTLGAVVLDVLAVALLLSVQIGVLALARPIAAELYLSGHEDTAPLVLQLSGGAFGARVMGFLLATIFIALLGAIATGTAIWRSGAVRKWAAVLFAIGFVLTMTDFPLIGWVGSALLVSVGGWIAWAVTRSAVATTKDAPPAPAGDRLAEA
jgi:hypothetical protein